MSIMALIAATICILVSYICGKVLYMIWWWPKMTEKKLKMEGIHGSPYKLFFGNIKEHTKMCKEAQKQPPFFTHDFVPRINPFLLHLSHTYKKIFVQWQGPVPRVMITDPKLIREVLNKVNEFHKFPPNPFIYWFQNGLATIDGDKWSTHRKILNPAFHIDKLKRIFPAFAICCDDLINKWEEMVSKTGSCELDVAEDFLNLAGDAISRAAFGSNIEEGRSIFTLQKELGEIVASSTFTMLFPSLRFLPTASNRRAMYIHKKVNSLIMEIIKKRDDVKRRGFSESDDMLGELLKARDREENRVTTEDVINECKQFYFAGQDTTATLMSWTMVILSMYPEWQDKARKEVFQVIGKSKPKFDDLNQLRLINMIFQEVLRLYPATFIFRSTPKSVKLGEMTIPAGVEVCVPTDLIHHDPKLWGDDALMFNPERFSEGVSKAAKEQSYFPFGWGPRKCIGMNFSLLEAKLMLSQILQHFWFEISPSYMHAPQVSLFLKPQYGAQIILHKL